MADHTLTADGIVVAPTVSTPTVSQVHGLTATGIVAALTMTKARLPRKSVPGATGGLMAVIPRGPMVDARTGRPTHEWTRFFEEIARRVSG